MYCDNCGKKIGDNSKFCKYCGAKVSEAEGDAPKQEAPSEKKGKVKKRHPLLIIGIIVVLIAAAYVLLSGLGVIQSPLSGVVGSLSEPQQTTPSGNGIASQNASGDTTYATAYLSDECKPPTELGHEPRQLASFTVGMPICIVMKVNTNFKLITKTFQNGAIAGPVQTWNLKAGSASTGMGFGATSQKGQYQTELYANDSPVPFKILKFEVV